MGSSVGFHIRVDEIVEDGHTLYRATYTDPAKASIGSFTGTTRDEAVHALDRAWEERTGVAPRQVGPRVLIHNNAG